MKHSQIMTIALGVTSLLGACDTGTTVDTHFRSEECFRQQQARIAAEWLDEVRAEFGPQTVQQLSTRESRAQFIHYVQTVAAQCPDCTRSNTLAALLGPVSELGNYPPVYKHYGQGFLDAAQHWEMAGSDACGAPAIAVAACESPFQGLGLAGYEIGSCNSAYGGLPVADSQSGDDAGDGPGSPGEGNSEGTQGGEEDPELPAETEESGDVDDPYPWPCYPPYESCPTEFQVL